MMTGADATAVVVLGLMVYVIMGVARRERR